MAAALLPLVAAAFLLFNLPSNIHNVALYIYVLLLNCVLRIGLSVFALPHSALTAEFTDDYSERSVISSFRALFIVVGTAAALLPAFWLIFKGEDALQSRDAYTWLGLQMALLIGGFGLTCILGILEKAIKLPVSASTGEEQQSNFFTELIQIFQNPSFLPLFGGAVLVLVGQGLTNTLNLHAFRYFWKLPSSLIQLPLLVLPVGMLFGTVAAGILLKRFEKRDGVVGAVAVLGVYHIFAVSVVIAGLVEPGSPVSTGLAVTGGLLFGACGAFCFVCFYSMIADAVDEHDLLFGVRREGLYAAGLLIGAKAATGIGALLAGVGLQLIGFSALSQGNQSAQVPESVATAVGLIWGPGAAMLVLLSIPVLRRYRIDRHRHEEVLSLLRFRRDGNTENRGWNPILSEDASLVK